MFTIEPPPPSSIVGIAARIPRHTPDRFTSRTSRQSSSEMSPAEPGMATAALLTMPSSRPWRSTAASTSASTSADDRTSVRWNDAPAPIAPATSRPPSSSTSPRTTTAPSLASASADARPMPVAAPVTATTFPSTRPATVASSGAPEPGFALLDERPDALVGVSRLAERRERRLLTVEAALEVEVGGDADELGHRPRGERSDLRDRARLREGGIEQVGRRDDLGDQADRPRVVRRQSPRGQQHVLRDEGPDGACEPLRAAAARAQAEESLREREHGGRGRDQDFAAQRDLEPASERVAVDRADHRRAERIEPREQLPAAPLVRDEPRVIETRVLADVRARDERSVARAGHHDDPHVCISLAFVQRGIELLEHRGAERVQLVRAVEREHERRVAPVAEHEVVGHTAPSSRIAAISSSEKPTEASTSSVCCPTDGGPARTVPGVAENRIGMPTTRIGSPSGRSTVVNSPLCATCGSSMTSSNVDTGAHQTSRVASRASQASASRSSSRCWIMRQMSSRSRYARSSLA